MKKTDCEYFGLCASCVLDSNLDEQKALKLARSREKLGEFYSGEFEFFTSSEFNFRSRAEFGFYQDTNELFFTMKSTKNERVLIDTCRIVDDKIVDLMPKIRALLKTNQELRSRLFGCEFVSTKSQIIAILLYHKDVESIASELLALSKALNVSIVARSRGKKLIFGDEILREDLDVSNSWLKYLVSHDGFIQPNRAINEKMLEFARIHIKNPRDLLELYCGHGNFTIALASEFRRVLATEINKNSIALARKNAQLNSLDNIDFLRMSAEELTRAFGGESFNRLANLDLSEFDFSHVLIDPPRAGCDSAVLELIKNIPNIIYVSCSQDTLARDLHVLSQTHKIHTIALFDQFVHTNHIETICLLSVSA